MIKLLLKKNKKQKTLVHFPTRLSRFGLQMFVTRNTVKEVKAKDSGKVSNDLSCASGLLVMLMWKAHKKSCKLVVSVQDFDKNYLVP